jgi:hypothetical protein
MLANQNMSHLGVRKLIVCSNGSLTNDFHDNSLFIKPIPVGITKYKSKNGFVQERAELHPDAIGFQASFAIRFNSLDNCHVSHVNMPLEKNNGFIISDFRKSLDRFVERAKSSNALNTLALRYVRRISNGSWLKDNKISYDVKKISLKLRIDNQVMDFEFANYEIHRFSFDEFDEKEITIAHYLEKCLKGEQICFLDIAANLNGNERYIYASQEPTQSRDILLMREMTDSTYTNQMYPSQIVGIATLWDKELGGELKKIDTWDTDQIKPLSMKDNKLRMALLNLDDVHPESTIGTQLLGNIIHGFTIPLSAGC